MTLEEEYQRKADALLRLATQADSMKERSRLIQEAVQWHDRAIEDRERRAARPAKDDGGAAVEA